MTMADKRWPPPTIADVDAAIALAPLQGPYLPWSAGALRPAGLITVLNEIAGNDHERVLECGGGISSVFIARLLAQRGRGWLVTLESDEKWAGWLRSQLQEEGLEQYATVVTAPLAPCAEAADDLEWYSADAVDAALDGLAPVQLLVVDGPQSCRRGMGLARLPALPILRHALAPDATVALDDIHRPGEREVLKRWEAEADLTFEIRDSPGIAVGRFGKSRPFPRF